MMDFSIAYAVIKEILKRGCITLFSTHYHKLTDEFENDPLVSLGHMACREEEDKMIFLYKLTNGSCPRSYGLNVAQMANIDINIINRAKEMSESYDEIHYKQNLSKKKEFMNIFLNLMTGQKSPSELKKLWATIREKLIENNFDKEQEM